MTGAVTAAELVRALPHVLDAPKTEAPVRMLCVRPGHNRRVFPERIRVTRDGGVEGDFEMAMPWLRRPDGQADPRIQVSLLPLRVLDLVWRDREVTPHPGDTIVADLDVSLSNLPPGSLIGAGSAVLRVSDLWNSGCAKWKVRFGPAAHAWVSDPAHEALRLRGILCSVERDGEIGIGDPIIRL